MTCAVTKPASSHSPAVVRTTMSTTVLRGAIIVQGCVLVVSRNLTTHSEDSRDERSSSDIVSGVL